MSRALEQTDSVSKVWCGRSWEGLADRRSAAFVQAQALRGATDQSSHQVISEVLEFLDATVVDLFRDEEDWAFRLLRPTPEAVLRALAQHVEISSFITAVIHGAPAGRTDLRVIHRLGDLLETHLLFEEEQVGPLFHDRPTFALAP